MSKRGVILAASLIVSLPPFPSSQPVLKTRAAMTFDGVKMVRSVASVESTQPKALTLSPLTNGYYSLVVAPNMIVLSSTNLLDWIPFHTNDNEGTYSSLIVDTKMEGWRFFKTLPH